MGNEFERTSKELKKVQDSVPTTTVFPYFTHSIAKIWGLVSKPAKPKLSEQQEVPNYGTFENKS